MPASASTFASSSTENNSFVSIAPNVDPRFQINRHPTLHRSQDREFAERQVHSHTTGITVEGAQEQQSGGPSNGIGRLEDERDFCKEKKLNDD